MSFVAKRTAISVQDMLETPYLAGGTDPAKGLDCLGCALEVHRRLGLFQPQFPIDRVTAQNWVLGPGWQELPCDAAALTELGDVVVSEGGGTAPLGVAVVFALGRARSAHAAPGSAWLLTATPGSGARVLRAGAFWRLVGAERIQGCYRWRPVGAAKRKP